MKKSLLILLLWFGIAPLLCAQEHAIVLEDTESFKMSSPLKGKLSVKRTVVVLDEEGSDEADFRVHTSPFEKVTAFKASVVYDDGRSESFSKGDLITVATATELADDNTITAFLPPNAEHYTITYEYEVEYARGISTFPAFIPVLCDGTRLVKGTYELLLPAGTKIIYHGINMPEPTVTDTGYRWEVKDIKAIVHEHFMPDPTKILPILLASPVKFTFDKVAGEQDSWTNLGNWYCRLQMDCDDLPAATRTAIHRMTDGCANDLEKIRVLYDYLREKTRYVSIQFGIGGFKPFNASVVDKTGFGDCKALTNYFACLLREIGIESFYIILNTDRKEMFPEFSSLGQANHVMLSVPIKNPVDTLYIECTNPSTPLGYRHEGIAGHDVLLLIDFVGQLAHVPAYADTLGVVENSLNVALKADGSADVQVTSRYTLDEAESLFTFRGRTEEQQSEALARRMEIQSQQLTVTDIRDNFNAYDGPDWVPAIEIDYRFQANTYARSAVDRIFVPVNNMAKRLHYQRKERVNPIEIRAVRNLRDRIVLKVPEGYSVEGLPKDLVMDEPWGRFTSTCRVEGGTVVIEQATQMRKCHEPSERYPDYKAFARALNKAYSNTIVLKRN